MAGDVLQVYVQMKWEVPHILPYYPVGIPKDIWAVGVILYEVVNKAGPS